MNQFKNILFLVFLTVGGSFLAPESHAQVNHDLGYIFGTIETHSGKEYQGFIRWGSEEVAWHDIFNSTKRSNAFNKPQNSNSKSWGELDWNFTSLWSNKYSGGSRSFACLFGDIKRLELESRERVNIVLKNGEVIKVQGGSNDIGGRLVISDKELGVVKLDWSKIRNIEFETPPRGILPDHDRYLFGTVRAGRGQKFEGYIKWDNDERLLSDVLDGKGCNDDSEMSFHTIVSIEKDGSRSYIVTNNGDSFHMSGTNDVNSGNHGIYMYVQGTGSVEVPWHMFQDITFKEKQVAGPPYNYFKADQGLRGEVTTYDGDKHEGLIIFDLDEMYGAEVLDGEDDRITYQIPMRNISIIRPKNSSYSYVELKNGKSLLLGDTQDVSDHNDGVIVIESDSNIHIKWDDVEEIVFRN